MVVGSVFRRGMSDLYSHRDLERAEKVSKCQGRCGREGPTTLSANARQRNRNLERFDTRC